MYSHHPDLVPAGLLEVTLDLGPAFGEPAQKRLQRRRASAFVCQREGKELVKRIDGLFFQPTVVTGVNDGMKVATEETFGPLAPLFRFETEDEVVDKANATIFGLASYFYARDVGRITRVQEALEYGIVGVNTGIISTEVAPFGGVKQSGLGREGSHHGIDDYLEMKYICLSI